MAKPKPGDANWSDAGYEISLGQERLAQRLRDIEGLMVVSETNPVTGGIDFVIGGKSAGAKLGAAQVTYDTSGRVATHDGWTLSYDSSGRVSSQTNGTQTQTFNYDTSGRFTGITES